MQFKVYWLFSVREIPYYGFKPSVSCVIFWLSDPHNSSVNVTNPKWRQIAYRIEQYLNFEIYSFFPAYFEMEREETKVKGLSEIRFSRIIFFLRLAGIPFKMKKISTLYAIYVITGTVCTCSTFLGMFIDVYLHRDDMRATMKNFRVLTGMTSIVWIYFSCR